jgi:hypothetical protein
LSSTLHFFSPRVTHLFSLPYKAKLIALKIDVLPAPEGPLKRMHPEDGRVSVLLRKQRKLVRSIVPVGGEVLIQI